ncbi:hypothetical protein [Mycolicibacterium elephantis]|uniref:Uncharacterized protein n=1 Tax=Mycolicibacterium elephantis TaxID=81858 RepID=A0A1X0CEQ0_9MYCO|nr:hypothetical protein [Mycolicibacterium elephantis]ORA58565.1 hypothetical protein BST23_25390 [Mycolicibacterium elephantis]
MGKVPSRKARLAHAAKHAELWNAGKKHEWVASWRTICPGEVRMFGPSAPRRSTASRPPHRMPSTCSSRSMKIKMITVQVNGNEMA